MAIQRDGIRIGTVSGGIVNFGGTAIIAPISVTQTLDGSGGSNSGAKLISKSGLSTTNQATLSELLGLIRTMLR
jgi:hypothetical protein